MRTLVPDYTALRPRRQPSSYSALWEPQIIITWHVPGKRRSRTCFWDISSNVRDECLAILCRILEGPGSNLDQRPAIMIKVSRLCSFSRRKCWDNNFEQTKTVSYTPFPIHRRVSSIRRHTKWPRKKAADLRGADMLDVSRADRWMSVLWLNASNQMTLIRLL
jgi:hypothetical protein